MLNMEQDVFAIMSCCFTSGECAKKGSHYIILYSDLPTRRKIYSQHIKRQIEEKKEFVLILPHHETTDMVRYVLFELAKVDVRKYELQNCLLIMNSARAYFGSSIDLISFVNSLVNYADQMGRNGVSQNMLIIFPASS
jgi:hypothetical protein